MFVCLFVVLFIVVCLHLCLLFDAFVFRGLICCLFVDVCVVCVLFMFR